VEPESYFEIVHRKPVQGGHSWVIKEKLTVADDGGEQSVLLKRTTATEVAALEAEPGPGRRHRDSTLDQIRN